jgi:hypothetical protein
MDRAAMDVDCTFNVNEDNNIIIIINDIFFNSISYKM